MGVLLGLRMSRRDGERGKRELLYPAEESGGNKISVISLQFLKD